jgi:hypothetical protein
MKIIAADLRRINRGAVLGAITLWLPEMDLRIYEVLWGRRGPDGPEWVRLPGRQWTSDDGATRYSKILAWGSERSERAFAEAALAAIHQLAAGEAAHG